MIKLFRALSIGFIAAIVLVAHIFPSPVLAQGNGTVAVVIKDVLPNTNVLNP